MDDALRAAERAAATGGPAERSRWLRERLRSGTIPERRTMPHADLSGAHVALLPGEAQVRLLAVCGDAGARLAMPDWCPETLTLPARAQDPLKWLKKQGASLRDHIDVESLTRGVVLRYGDVSSMGRISLEALDLTKDAGPLFSESTEHLFKFLLGMLARHRQDAFRLNVPWSYDFSRALEAVSREALAKAALEAATLVLAAEDAADEISARRRGWVAQEIDERCLRALDAGRDYLERCAEMTFLEQRRAEQDLFHTSTGIAHLDGAAARAVGTFLATLYQPFQPRRRERAASVTARQCAEEVFVIAVRMLGPGAVFGNILPAMCRWVGL